MCDSCNCTESQEEEIELVTALRFSREQVMLKEVAVGRLPHPREIDAVVSGVEGEPGVDPQRRSRTDQSYSPQVGNQREQHDGKRHYPGPASLASGILNRRTRG